MVNPGEWQITNANLVLPEGKRKPGGCIFSRGRIRSLLDRTASDPDLLNLNLHGFFVYPGLINAHDSLIASYHPLPDSDPPCTNWLAWDNQLKSSPIFRERMLLEIEELYRLGAYRNLLSGATTVVDHIPHFVRKSAPSDLPLYLLPDFGISHSACSYSLDWGEGIGAEYEKARKKGLPYIIHIAEGFDRENRDSLRHLEEMGGLGENTVLVHGLSLSEDDLDRIARAGASLVWCPHSNLNIYGKTAPIDRILARGIPVSLGTDSAMTGSVNLFSELKKARRILEEKTGDSPDPEQLFRMVTENAARSFRLGDRGMITGNAVADLLIMEGKYPEDPYRSLIEAEPGDIFLVIGEGRPLVGDPAVEPIFAELNVEFDRFTVQGVEKLVFRGLKNVLENVAEAVGRYVAFHFLPVG